MEKLKLNGKHILLLLLYSPGKGEEINEPITGRTRIIKMMFLFKEQIKKDFFKDSNIELVSFPEYFSWDYGPFSKDVYNDIEFFINNGFIEDSQLKKEMSEIEQDEYENWAEDYLFENEQELLASIQKEESFRLSQRGIDFVEQKLYKYLSANQKEILKKFKKSINESSLDAILRYTYLKFPEYTTKSKIKEKVIG